MSECKEYSQADLCCMRNFWATTWSISVSHVDDGEKKRTLDLIKMSEKKEKDHILTWNFAKKK